MQQCPGSLSRQPHPIRHIYFQQGVTSKCCLQEVNVREADDLSYLYRSNPSRVPLPLGRLCASAHCLRFTRRGVSVTHVLGTNADMMHKLRQRLYV